MPKFKYFDEEIAKSIDHDRIVDLLYNVVKGKFLQGIRTSSYSIELGFEEYNVLLVGFLRKHKITLKEFRDNKEILLNTSYGGVKVISGNKFDVISNPQLII